MSYMYMCVLNGCSYNRVKVVAPLCHVECMKCGKVKHLLASGVAAVVIQSLGWSPSGT